MRLYKFCLWKAYFDKGMGILGYAKYLIAFYGLASANVKTTMIVAVGYAVAALIIGRLWYYYRIIDTEIEIGNIVNPFAREIRGKFGLPNKRKL